MSPSAAELGSVCEFRGSHVVADNGSDAVRTWGVLLACCDGEAAQFKQERERGHSRGKVVVVHRGLRSSLRCALVVVATVAAAMMAMATTAAATRGVTLQRWGNAMAMCDGDKARMCAADNAGLYVCCAVGANESVGLAGPIKMSGGRGASSAVANAPVSPVSLTLSGLLARS